MLIEFFLAPHTSTPIPVIFTARGNLRYRPAGSNFEWTSPVSLRSLSDRVDIQVCRSNNDYSTFTYVMQIETQAKNSDNMGYSHNLYHLPDFSRISQIKLLPPLIIENLLTTKLEFKVSFEFTFT